MLTRRNSLLLIAATLGLAACGGGNWETSYTPVAAPAANFRLAAVSVSVPNTLTVSENESVYVPKADIVWVEEPAGDRRAQVKAIFEEGISAGASGLRGATPVRIEAVVQKFHALNMKSRYSAPAGTGVYDIAFIARIVDARTGAVLVPDQLIRADAPALTGAAGAQEQAQGKTQRKANVAQISATIAGWLGLGPDNRTSFRRMGG